MLELITILAVWRITYLLHYEEGPYHIIANCRRWLSHHTSVFDCFFCLSIWVALPFAFIFPYWFIHWLGFSAGAMVLEDLVDKITT